MHDTDLCVHLLGLTPSWTVASVDLLTEEQQVDVLVEHPRGHRFPCPRCEAPCPLHDHAPERGWRHLDSCQFQTFLRASPPRVRCEEHGVLQARLPWAEPESRFTLL